MIYAIHIIIKKKKKIYFLVELVLFPVCLLFNYTDLLQIQSFLQDSNEILKNLLWNYDKILESIFPGYYVGNEVI